MAVLALTMYPTLTAGKLKLTYVSKRCNNSPTSPSSSKRAVAASHMLFFTHSLPSVPLLRVIGEIGKNYARAITVSLSSINEKTCDEHGDDCLPQLFIPTRFNVIIIINEYYKFKR